MTATDCQLASLAQRPGARGGLEVAVASGGPGAARDRAAAGQRALRRRRAAGAWAPSACPAGARERCAPSALSRGGRSLRIAGLPHGTTAVRVRLAAGVVAPGHRCALSAWLTGGGGPPVRVVQRC